MLNFEFEFNGTDKVFYNSNHDNLLDILNEPTRVKEFEGVFTKYILNDLYRIYKECKFFVKNEYISVVKNDCFELCYDYDSLTQICIDGDSYFKKFLTEQDNYYYPYGIDIENYTCERCGDLTATWDSITADDGSIFCCTICATKSGYVRCDVCNEWYKVEDTIEVEGDCICQTCYDDGYICDCCGKFVKYIESLDIFDKHFCSEECAHDKGYVRCDVCNEWLTPNGYFYDEESDSCLCEQCYFNREQERVNYELTHGNPELTFYGGAGKIKFGFELEKEFYDKECSYGFINDFKNNDNLSKHLWLKSDASLDDTGVEIVSHPCTIDYFKNEVELSRLFRYLRINSEKTYNGGLHIHFSRKYLLPYQEINLSLFVNKFNEELINISNRENKEYAAYHEELTIGLTNNFSELTPSYLKERYDRYVALNWHNKSHGELRIFYSTSKLSELLAYLELTQAMIEYCYGTQIQYLIDSDFNSFVKFVRLQGDKFINLVTMLNEKGF